VFHDGTVLNGSSCINIGINWSWVDTLRPLFPEERAPDTYRVRGRVNTRAGPNAMAQRMSMSLLNIQIRLSSKGQWCPTGGSGATQPYPTRNLTSSGLRIVFVTYGKFTHQQNQYWYLKNSVFWDITPCNPFKVSRRIGGTFYLRNVSWISRITRPYIPEDRTLHCHLCENLKS
jgi:hypothetical protein